MIEQKPSINLRFNKSLIVIHYRGEKTITITK